MIYKVVGGRRGRIVLDEDFDYESLSPERLDFLTALPVPAGTDPAILVRLSARLGNRPLRRSHEKVDYTGDTVL